MTVIVPPLRRILHALFIGNELLQAERQSNIHHFTIHGALGTFLILLSSSCACVHTCMRPERLRKFLIRRSDYEVLLSEGLKHHDPSSPYPEVSPIRRVMLMPEWTSSMYGMAMVLKKMHMSEWLRNKEIITCSNTILIREYHSDTSGT